MQDPIRGIDYLTMADLFWDHRPPPEPPMPAEEAEKAPATVFAKDIMTRNVVTIGEKTPVGEIARLLIERRISAVPVVDDDGKMLGIVSEGDLVHRIEGDYKTRRPWWLSIFGEPEDDPHEYAKLHGSYASEIMTRKVVSVSEYAYLVEIARLLEEHRIKRVPVLREDKLVGIVSRADLIRALVKSDGGALQAPTPGDEEIREALLKEFHGHPWADSAAVNVIVTGGVVRLFGLVDSQDAREALRVAAENIPGVVGVEDELGVNTSLMTDV